MDARTPSLSLAITVEAGRKLAAADFGISGSKSDPYVIVTEAISKVEIGRTESKAQTLDPVFGNRFSHILPASTLWKNSLVFVVWDHDVLSSDDEVGGVRLPGRLLIEKLVVSKERRGGDSCLVLFDDWLKLSRPHHVTGDLKIKVEIDIANITEGTMDALIEKPLTIRDLGIPTPFPENVKVRIVSQGNWFSKDGRLCHANNMHIHIYMYTHMYSLLSGRNYVLWLERIFDSHGFPDSICCIRSEGKHI